MTGRPIRAAVVHLDESCLGNGREGPTPGGTGGLIEVRTTRGVERREFAIASADTTNNRMALAGAIAVLQLLAAKGNRLQVLIVSDSEYLVRGVREWLPGWISRGWKRKAGPIENLELWRALDSSLRQHDPQLTWVRGHAGHPKNEFANDLAVAAAKTQATTDGLIESTLLEWLGRQREKGRYLDYDPDQAFTVLEQRLKARERLPLALEERRGPTEQAS